MSSGSESKKDMFHRAQTCGICQKDLKGETAVYNGGNQFGFICSSCHENNSEKDIELMSNMFLAFGGSFGMRKNSEIEMLKDLIDEIHNKKRTMSPKELRLRLLYIALLHGITPQEFAAWDENLLIVMYNF
ncbi:MAG: hypothetical protein ACXADU_18405 [Promethearchaeota archaeon]|jgi:hypothetical protein